MICNDKISIFTRSQSVDGASYICNIQNLRCNISEVMGVDGGEENLTSDTIKVFVQSAPDVPIRKGDLLIRGWPALPIVRYSYSEMLGNYPELSEIVSISRKEYGFYCDHVAFTAVRGKGGHRNG